MKVTFNIRNSKNFTREFLKIMNCPNWWGDIEGPEWVLENGVYSPNKADHFVNDTQTWSISSTQVSYQGHRCPLVEGASKTVKSLIEGEGLEVIKYDTSDKRLRWNETLEGYVLSRGSDSEKLESPRILLRQLSDEFLRCLTMSDKKAYASFPKETYALTRSKRVQEMLASTREDQERWIKMGRVFPVPLL